MNPTLKIALVGNPNSGKSTLFNVLTGMKQKTGNFPGVTVDKKTGMAMLADPQGKPLSAYLIDLPGTYSLQPKSLDEEVTCELLQNSSNPDYPDLIVVVADATNLKRSLYLVTQLIELQRPVVLALNMIDQAKSLNTKNAIDALSHRLGIPVLPVSARRDTGIEELKKAIASPVLPSFKKFVSAGSSPSLATIERYNAISAMVKDIVQKDENTDRHKLTQVLDKILTHRIWGFLCFLVVLSLIFQSIFYFASFPMKWIEQLFIDFSAWGRLYLPKGEFAELLINGILAGLSGVLVFIPQIALLFGFIAVLEDTGYMARVSFIMDRLMRKFGLNGRSVIPLISGIACAVPAIMSARTISNWKERLVTILVTPLMSCSARLPVYTLLISLIFPVGKGLHFFNVNGIVLLLMYAIGFIFALAAAFGMKYLIRSKEKSYFIMELPVYRSPRWKTVLYTMFEKVKVFIFDAGKIIVAISIVLWVLSSHGPSSTFSSSASESEKLKNSYAGNLGRAIEPAIAPLGFDWKIGISLITSFAAREVFVGTMATIYSVGDTKNTQSIREKMLEEKDINGNPVYSKATGLSLMIFFAFAMQCMSTLAVVKRETKSWKWPVVQFLYMGFMAYGASFIVYHIFR